MVLVSSLSNRPSISACGADWRSLLLVRFFEKPYNLPSALRGSLLDLLVYSQAAFKPLNNSSKTSPPLESSLDAFSELSGMDLEAQDVQLR